MPLGTKVQITNVSNGKTVVARVTDRGPYVPNRVVDLSLAAFKEIASLNEGVVKVNVKTIKE